MSKTPQICFIILSLIFGYSLYGENDPTQKTRGPLSPIFNEEGEGDINYYLHFNNVSEERLNQITKLLSHNSKVLKQLFKILDEKGVAFDHRDKKILDLTKKYIKLEKLLANLTADQPIFSQAHEALSNGKLKLTENLLVENFKTTKKAKEKKRSTAKIANALGNLKALQIEYKAAERYHEKAVKLEPENRLYQEDFNRLGREWYKFKCTKYDYRIFHFCLESRFFEPSARIYFDMGKDDQDEIDIFNDENLDVNLDIVAFYVPWRLGGNPLFDAWSWGPMLGVGISSRAQDSEDRTKTASSAPVVTVSYGGMVQYILKNDGASFGFEIGRATGFSSDESFGDINDSATYVGIRINIGL